MGYEESANDDTGVVGVISLQPHVVMYILLLRSGWWGGTWGNVSVSGTAFHGDGRLLHHLHRMLNVQISHSHHKVIV